MQFDPQRAFPYPVLRPGVDDYSDGEFQAAVEFAPQTNKPTILFSAHFELSIEPIKRLIARERAKYVVVVACRDTYFRKALTSKEPEITGKFHKGELRGEVQVFPYIMAEEHISDFRCELINEEFGPGPFSFEKGAVLAVDEPKAVYVDRDLFRPITSVFELVKNDNLQGAEWRVDLSGEHVRIGVAPEMKEKLDTFRNTLRNRAILINSIYFAAVMHCLRQLAKSDDCDDYRWAQVIRQQCHQHHIDLNVHDEYYVAQQLLKQPLRLLDTYVFQEGKE